MKLQSTTGRFWLLLVALVISGAIINTWERAGEAKVARTSLKQFPAQLGSWEQLGRELRFDDETETILRADEYLARNFRSHGHVVSLYVGYYGTQRTGATYHSPLNCLPGSGWELNEPGTVEIKPANGAPAFEANSYVVQHGSDRQLMIYWYQGRGRAVANEYRDKVYTVLDSIRLRRSDGAMVRVLVPVRGSESEAVETAAHFAAQVAPNLS